MKQKRKPLILLRILINLILVATAALLVEGKAAGHYL